MDVYDDVMFSISKKIQKAYNERDQFASMALRAERERSYAISQRDEAVELLAETCDRLCWPEHEFGKVKKCRFCGNRSELCNTIPHDLDCPVTKARQLIERIEGEK